VSEEVRIEEIRERARKLPMAPWHTTKLNSRTRIYSDFLGKPNYFVDVSRETPRAAEFIAHAIEDVPYLLKRVEELEKENERLREFGETACRFADDLALIYGDRKTNTIKELKAKGYDIPV
jgi:hypothetical protein